MTERVIVVTAANEAYFGYLQELLASFSACGADNDYDFGILDVGLSAGNIEWLKHRGVSIVVRPEWPVGGLAAQPEWYKAIVCRPFLPRYFDAWHTIVYIDADSWFQTTDALALAVAGARQDGFAVVPMVERAHWHPSATAAATASRHWHKENLAQGFGGDVAERFLHFPIIPAGFFAARIDAPHWLVWQQLLLQTLQRKVYFSAEQAALCLMVHQSGLPTHFLPGYCHWTCHLGIIGIDEKSGIYVEPYLPHTPLAVLGLSAHSKTEPMWVRTTDGRMLKRALRYGQQHRTRPVSVGLQGASHDFYGIASPRFRASVFDMLGRDHAVRFLQIGAMDGVSFDPIHRHVKRYGWQGILVEPLPDMMSALQRNYADTPGLTFVQVAIAEQSGRQAMTRVRQEAVSAGRLPAWAAGLASLTPERNALSGKNVAAEHATTIGEESEKIEVECLSFADFEKQYALGAINLLQIDAEGYDFDILRQINLERHHPECVHLEVACLSPQDIKSAMDHLRNAGYICYIMEDGKDLLALQREFAARQLRVM